VDCHAPRPRRSWPTRLSPIIERSPLDQAGPLPGRPVSTSRMLDRVDRDSIRELESPQLGAGVSDAPRPWETRSGRASILSCTSIGAPKCGCPLATACSTPMGLCRVGHYPIGRPLHVTPGSQGAMQNTQEPVGSIRQPVSGPSVSTV